MNEILIFGHKNPDADAICAPIAYADFKRRTGTENAVACRCGDTNDRIDFILNTFRQAAPRFIPDITPRVSDIMRDKVEHAREDETAFDAMSRMEEKNIRMLPIVDEKLHIKGLISVFKLSHYYMPSRLRLQDTRNFRASIQNIAKSIHAKIHNAIDAQTEQELILMVAAMEMQTFSKRFEKFPPERVVIVVGDRIDVQFAAIRAGVRLIVITGGLHVEDDILEMARHKNVSIMVSPYDSATTALLVRASVSIREMLDTDYLAFHKDTNLIEARRAASGVPQNIFPVTNGDDELCGVFSKSDFLVPVEKKIILIDHNEMSQAVDGAQHATILEIIDHHKLGSLATNQPILFMNIPIGSSCSIVADLFQKHNIKPSPEIAGIMMSGVITDTLNLKSPTTTSRDAELLNWLGDIAGMDHNSLADKIFASGSILSVCTPDQVIVSDCKEYTEDGKKFSVAQVEELGFTKFHEKKQHLLRELGHYAEKHDYLFSALFVTDINTNSSFLLVQGAARFLETIDYEKVEPNIWDMPGVVSRKKQLLPYLLRCIHAMKT